MWSAIANFIKWLFVPDELWLAAQVADLNALMEKKLGLFFWLFNTLKNFLGCFSNLQDYSGLVVRLPTGGRVVLFYGEMWDVAMSYMNPLFTGIFVIWFCSFCIKRIMGFFER